MLRRKGEFPPVIGFAFVLCVLSNVIKPKPDPCTGCLPNGLRGFLPSHNFCNPYVAAEPVTIPEKGTIKLVAAPTNPPSVLAII